MHDVAAGGPPALGDVFVALDLPAEFRAGTWENALTGERLDAGKVAAVGDVLGTFPVALLVKENQAAR